MSSQQHADLVFFLNHLPLQFGSSCSSIRALGLKLIRIQLGDHALPQSRLADSDRLLPGRQRALGNIQLHVELPEIEIRLRDPADELEDDSASVFVTRE